MSSQVTVRYWAAARRAAGRESEQLRASTIEELLAQLRSRPALRDVVSACAVLVDNVASHDNTILTDGSVVDLLPPFAGG
jgi:molybdopterin converting factor small subunit